MSTPARRTASGSSVCSASTRRARLAARTGSSITETLRVQGSPRSDGAPSREANSTSSRSPLASSRAGISRLA